MLGEKNKGKKEGEKVEGERREGKSNGKCMRPESVVHLTGGRQTPCLSKGQSK